MVTSPRFEGTDNRRPVKRVRLSLFNQAAPKVYCSAQHRVFISRHLLQARNEDAHRLVAISVAGTSVVVANPNDAAFASRALRQRVGESTVVEVSQADAHQTFDDGNPYPSPEIQSARHKTGLGPPQAH